MIAILDDPAIRHSVAPLTPAAYRHLAEHGLISERTELIEGVVVEKMSKSPRHSAVVTLLTRILSQALPATFSVRTEQPLSIGNSEPEPDIAVVVGDPSSMHFEHPAHAELIIEVALSTVELDRQKAAIYAAAGIPHYWIVNLRDRQIESFQAPAGNSYREMRLFQSGKVELWPGIAIEFEQLIPALTGKGSPMSEVSGE